MLDPVNIHSLLCFSLSLILNLFQDGFKSSSQIFPRTRGNGYLGNGISYDYQYEMATIPNSGIENGQDVASV